MRPLSPVTPATGFSLGFFLGLAHHDGGKENKRRALQFLSDKEETAGTPSLRRETRRPHREEVICLGFLGIFQVFFRYGYKTHRPLPSCVG